MWATVAVGQAPGNVPAAFSPLPPVIICEGKGGSTTLPALFLTFLGRVWIADGDVGLLPDFGHLTVMALGSFWNSCKCRLYLSGNGIVSPAATVPGGIEMGFEVTDAGHHCREWQRYNPVG